jgi:hypothetical protein
MAQLPISMPKLGLADAMDKSRFANILQSDGNLSYLEFISAVKSLWEESFPNYPIKATSSGDNSFTWFNPATQGYDTTDAIIVYSLELRKAHSVEPKPRMRQITSDNVYVYGQRFQNVVAFTAMSPVGKRLGSDPNSIYDDQDNSYLVESLIESFEDFMLEYTPIFKKIGASELVYSRRLSDSEVNRDSKDVHKRTVTYMLTTEKVFAAQANTIEKIAIDVRQFMAYEPEFFAAATPNYEDININLIDLENTATPRH